MQQPTNSKELLPRLYEELRKLARAKLTKEPFCVLQTTALVHEAYLRLDNKGEVLWKNRNHFLGSAAEAMRRVLIDQARRRLSLKRGEGRRPFLLSNLDHIEDDSGTDNSYSAEDLLALEGALRRLEKLDPKAARIVMLRFFAGISVEETAKTLDVSTRTVNREWVFAKAWLLDQMAAFADSP